MSNKWTKFSNGGEESATVYNYSDQCAVQELLDHVNSGKYGSVTKDVKALVSRKMEVLQSLLTMYPDLEYSVNGEVSGSKDVVDSESLNAKNTAPITNPVLIIESDDEEDGERRLFPHFQEIAFPRPVGLLTQNVLVSLCIVLESPLLSNADSFTCCCFFYLKRNDYRLL